MKQIKKVVMVPITVTCDPDKYNHYKKDIIDAVERIGGSISNGFYTVKSGKVTKRYIKEQLNTQAQ
jgi:hypothetical protein